MSTLLIQIKLTILISILTIHSMAAQNIDTLTNGKSIFSYDYQFSSIAVYNDHFYIPAEKCNKIIVIGMDGIRQADRRLAFDSLSIFNTQIEGAALYKHYLLLADESKENHRVYSYNLHNGVLDTVRMGGLTTLDNDIGYFGIEGIAVSESAGICYVLKERNENFESEIRQFRIRQENGMIFFDSVSNTIVEHDKDNTQAEKNWHYTDIYHDEDTKRLYLLKSFFVDYSSSLNRYHIDTLEKITGRINRDFIPKTGNKLFFDLSDEMKKTATISLAAGKRYSTNLEGICFYAGDCYIISDNKWGDSADCNILSDERTLFLKITALLPSAKK